VEQDSDLQYELLQPGAGGAQEEDQGQPANDEVRAGKIATGLQTNQR
jgi:hypothetical protein